MKTREEYAEAAELCETLSRYQVQSLAKHYELAARVLRQLAEGAVLCSVDTAVHEQGSTEWPAYTPIENKGPRPVVKRYGFWGEVYYDPIEKQP
jgi:hypothetical protein